MSLEITAVNLPDLVASLGMLALAALLLWAAPRHSAHRAFAVLLVTYAFGGLAFVGDVGFAGTDPALSDAFSNVGIYAILSWPFATAFFALRFLDPDRRTVASRPVAWAILVATIAVLGAYAVDHDVVASTRADGTIVLGPLGVFWFTHAVPSGLTAFVFAWAARRPANDRRGGLFLAAAAFTLLAAYWSTFLAMGWLLTGDSLATLRGPAAGAAFTLLLARAMLWIGPAAVAAALVTAMRAPLRDDDAARRPRRILFAAAVASSLTALVVALLVATDVSAFFILPFAVDGALRVGMMVLLAVALLKRPVLGAETRLRIALSKSTVAAVFVTVFFVASEAAQQFFGATLGGTYVGIAAAGMLVFAMAPLHRAAERLAGKAVPVNASGWGPPEGAPADRETSYRHAVELALRDRHLTRDEERRLLQLAHHLGIPPVRAAAIHDEVEARGRTSP